MHRQLWAFLIRTAKLATTNRPIHGESLPQQTKLVPSLDHAETAQARSIEPTGHAMGKPSDAKSSTPTAQLLERASLC